MSTEVAEEIRLGKRTHRNVGFYSSFLQYNTKKKVTRSCRNQKNVSAASSLTATVTGVSKDEPCLAHSQRETTFVPSTKFKKKGKDVVPPGNMFSDILPPAAAATTRKHAADKTESVDLQAKQESSVQEVVAVVTADPNTQSKVIWWLKNHEPLLHDLVNLEVTAGQLIVKGSLKQVQQILYDLAQVNDFASEEGKPRGQLSASTNLGLSVGAPFAFETNGVPVSSDTGVAYPLTSELWDVDNTVEISSTDFDADREIISTAQSPVKKMYFEIKSNNFSLVQAEKVNTLETLLCQKPSDTANRNASSLVKSFSDSETEHALSIPVGITLPRNTNASSNQGSSVLKTTRAKKRSSQSTFHRSEPFNKRHLAKKSLLTQAAKDIAMMSTDSSDVERSIETPNLQIVSENFCCKICGKISADDNALRGHMLSHHGKKDVVPSYFCDICTLVFPNKHTFHLHLKNQHEGPDVSCLICGKRFQCRRYLRTHIQRHAGVKKCECPICGWSFFERHKLKYHMERHKEESERNLPYQCVACGKKFVNRAAWSDHCNTHSGQRPFQCDICSASFSHRVGLGRHKLVHVKVKPHECNICHRTFAVKPKLLEHLTTHTGVSKHTCPHCCKVFTAAFSLKRHLTKCEDTGWNKGDREGINSLQALSQCPTQDTAVVTGDEFAQQALGISDAGASTHPEIDSEQIFVCGTCSLSYSTLQEAEQHAVTHVLEAETLQVLEIPLPTACDGLSSESEIRLIKLPDVVDDTHDADQCLTANRNAQNADSTGGLNSNPAFSKLAEKSLCGPVSLPTTDKSTFFVEIEELGGKRYVEVTKLCIGESSQQPGKVNETTALKNLLNSTEHCAETTTLTNTSDDAPRLVDLSLADHIRIDTLVAAAVHLQESQEMVSACLPYDCGTLENQSYKHHLAASTLADLSAM